MKLPGFLTRILNAIRPGEPRVYVSTRQAGVLVNEDTAMTLPEWAACVSVITRTIAALPWGVYQKTANGRKELDNATAWLLNNRPNPEMSAFAFRETMLAHAINWGNGYAEIVFDGAGRPQALWPLTPDRVQPDRDENGALIYKINRGDGEPQITLPAWAIFHVHGLGFDGITGYSMVRMAARSIGVGMAQDVFAQAFYANGTVFGSSVEMPGGLSPQQIKDAEAYYNEKHGGPGNAFRVKVSPSGTKMHPMGMPMTDAQFIESRQMSVTMAARWLGVPPHKIADLSRATNNNIEHQGIEFVTDAIIPWTVRLEQEANFKLIGARTQGRVFTKLSVNALMRGDSKARAEFYRTMLTLGVMSVNEVRALEDLNGIGTAGDANLVQLNQTTLQWLVDNPGSKAEAPPKAEPDMPAAMTAMLMSHRDNAESVVGALSNVAKTVATMALKEQPAHVFNLHPAPVNITQGDTYFGDGMVKLQAHIAAPEVKNHVHVEPAAITVNAGDVNMPEGCIAVEAHIETPQVQNFVTLQQPNIEVHPASVTVQPQNIEVHPAAVTVQPAAITVQSSEVVVHVPQAPAPLVTVQNQVTPTDVIVQNNMPPAIVNVTAHMPDRITESETQIERDAKGNIIRSTSTAIESDA